MTNSSLADDTLTTEAAPTLIDELIRSVATGNAQQRLRVLQRVTDLFVAGSRRYSAQQIGLFDDVLQQLSAEVERKARAKLANRMASLETAPPKLVRALAFDNSIDVAGPVLTNSPLLCDEDLVENAATKSQNHLYAIAQRLKLSESVTDVLVKRGNRRVVRTVAGNPGARFSLAGFGKLTARARYDRKLTLTVGQRSDLPRQYFLKLLENASASVRAKLEAANPQAAAAIRNTIDEVATTMQHEVREASHEHAVAARDARRRFNAHPIAEVNVHAPAQAQEFEKTVVALAKLGRFPVDLVERALLDEGEDMVLLLARAAGCSWVTTRELLLMYAAKRQMQQDDLSKAFERFNRLSPETAQRVVRFHERRIKLRDQSMANDIRPTKQTAKAGVSPSPTDAQTPALIGSTA
ncbi:MAG TPA: DUF2336 domain-containing protein [Steroidobacteraceae bacterium]|nr:DUF2336 domain-containing protein [Steroidobacteraceae bacterium]